MKKIVLLLLMVSANAFATPVNVNTADAMTISKSLKGITLKKADAIVSYRVKNGLFKTVDEVAHVPEIGEKLVASNKKDILVDEANATKPADAAAAKAVESKSAPDTAKKALDSKSGAAPAPVSIPEAKPDAKSPATAPKK